MELPDNQRTRHTAGFSQVFVSGEKMIFYGGPRGRSQHQTLSIRRNPEGTIYLDDNRTILTNFDPKNEVIELNSISYGFKIMWKKAGDSPPIMTSVNGWTQRSDGGGYSYDWRNHNGGYSHGGGYSYGGGIFLYKYEKLAYDN